ncbi:MAG: tyrosine decarboxylase MfnA [Candidatus Bathyarchaeota archaeon]|nr:tyrosine decarboxylase MfnA [Candidatus Bathyarchaeota archaeon]
MRMENEGLPQTSVLKELESRLNRDFTYSSGRIIGSMCTCPHPLARKVYTRFLDRNLGDSGLSPALVKLEKKTVHMLGTLLSNPKASGHIVTGGTEANTLALWAAKKLSKKNHCEVIVPASAHYSFNKAADLLSLKIVRVGLNSRFQVDTKAVEKAVNSSTIAIVGVAGTTGLGVVDPISELSEIAVKKDLYLHVDAAFGGFVLPFLKELGFSVPDFDFSLPGVCSITIDPHKMGLAPIPAGGILFRNERLRKAVAWNVSYLAGGKSEQTTFVGTRSGASVIAVWALLKHLGTEGYKRIVRSCVRLTWKLAVEIQKINGLDVMTEPTMNIVGIKSEVFDIRRIARELRLRKWAVSLFPNHIRIVVMPHVRKLHIEEFLEDLKDIVNKLGG